MMMFPTVGPLIIAALAFRPSQPLPLEEVCTKLDAALSAKWKALSIVPEERCDDATFLRRVWLDLAGRVPPALRASTFLEDQRADKRTRLIRELLASNDFNENWARVWTQRLTGKRPIRQASLDGPVLQKYLRDSFAAQKPYGQVVAEMICGSGMRDSSGPANFLLSFEAKPAALTGAIAEKFLGITLACAQCHDHPHAQWKQEDFWGMAAFFARIKSLQNSEDANFMAVLEAVRGELQVPDSKAKPDANGQVPMKTIKPRLLFDKQTLISGSRRQMIAKWITSTHNPYFAKNTVSQVWEQLFGNRLAKTLDRSDGETTRKHREILDLLAADFSASGHDLKRLVQIVTLSRAYQLKSNTLFPSSPAEESARECKIQYFACYPVRPLSVDQVFFSIAQATGHKGDEPEPKDEAQEDAQAANDTPVSLLTEQPLTLQRALAQLNGGYVQKAVQAGAKVTVAVNGERPGPAHADWIFLATLARRPTNEEATHMLQMINGDRRNRGLEDAIWVILNSQEFNTNH
jgi:hypothetical protein